MTLTTGGRVQSVQSDNIRRLPGFCGSCRLRCWKTRSRRSCIMMNLRVIIRRAAKVTPYSHDGSPLALCWLYPARVYDTDSGAKAPRSYNEKESEVLLVNRVADRRRDYFDHRRHRNAEPASRPDRGQRSLGCRF